MNKKTIKKKLTVVWGERAKLWAEWAKLRAEGAKLWAEGAKLRAEGDKLWADTVLSTVGNTTIDWAEVGTDNNNSSYRCTLGNGMVFEP